MPSLSPAVYIARRGIILPLALGISAVILLAVLAAGVYVRHSLSAVTRAQAQARAQAFLALDTAMAQLQAYAVADTTATASASLWSAIPNPRWCGAWAQGSTTPVWLVSGTTPHPGQTADTQLDSAGLRAPLVVSSGGAYAYAIEDLSTTTAYPPAAPLPAAYSPVLLRQQSLFPPYTADYLSASQLARPSFGVLSRPLLGGLKQDLDAATQSTALAQTIARWRDPASFVSGRPLVYAEAALLMGVYRAADNTPQLALAFWADAWNPYSLTLPFNAKGTADLRLRVEGPAGVARFYNTAGALVGLARLDISEHTSSSPVMVDLYGAMAPGEVRFITHYRLLPLGAEAYDDAVSVEVEFPAGGYSFIFETLQGQPIQKITNIPFRAFTKRWGYNTMSLAAFSANTAQWVWGFTLREPLSASLLSSADPRGSRVAFDQLYTADTSPIHAQTNFNYFSHGDTYRDGAQQVLFDLPETPLISVGSLLHTPQLTTGALTLGSSSAGTANTLFDDYFFSTLPYAQPGSSPLALANAHLAITGSPAWATLYDSPAQHLLLRGAFNINSTDVYAWQAHLADKSYAMPFRPPVQAGGIALSSSQRLAWARSIVAYLQQSRLPLRSVSQLAALDLLPPAVFARSSALWQPRGDTFLVTVYARTPSSSAVVGLRAVVQRVALGATARSFRILSWQWFTPPAAS